LFFDGLLYSLSSACIEVYLVVFLASFVVTSVRAQQASKLQQKKQEKRLDTLVVFLASDVVSCLLRVYVYAYVYVRVHIHTRAVSEVYDAILYPHTLS